MTYAYAECDDPRDEEVSLELYRRHREAEHFEAGGEPEDFIDGAPAIEHELTHACCKACSQTLEEAGG